ncbi:PucR family transcriptional regulator [Amphibacillus sp. Q70]|uniref:PucR family transcriptional regulator n=1 Tax=Amphibacillus sp. Q70 TaxID=3453416 RepID=UPI003F874ABF
MRLNVEKMLSLSSFAKAKLITPAKFNHRHVSSIMVLEGPDIELWGRSGQVLLSSFFAFQNLTLEEIQTLLEKMNDCGIAALVIKMDRLISQIPPHIITFCEQLELPLIKISKSVQYEPILVEVMTELINKNLKLLNIYYQTHTKLNKLALKEPKLSETLLTLKELIHCPVSLINQLNQRAIHTDEDYQTYQEMKTLSFVKERYMNCHYTRHKVTYQEQEQKNYSILKIDIPNINAVPYQLIVHETDQTLDEEVYMIIESTVSFLQLELLKRYAITQNDFSYKNDIMSDILHARVESQEEILEKIKLLKLATQLNYHVVSISYDNKIKEQGIKQKQNHHLRLYVTGQLEQAQFNYAYLMRKNKMILIIEEKSDIKPYMESLFKQAVKVTNIELNQMKIGISQVGDIFHISQLYQQTKDIIKVMTWLEEDGVLSYKDIGVFKLFVNQDSHKQLIEYIPDAIKELERVDSDLTDTLRTFLDTNQNYKETGDRLFVHPKTVRYRINKIKKIIDLDFHDPEWLLQINIGLRLIKLMRK